jgi:TRAP-type C4-dicarboxylate transport system permease small subunit
MKYLKTLYFIAQVAICIAVILGGVRLAGALCTATMPLLDALFAWLAARALPIAVTIIVGFIVWIFGDVCDAQARKERRR